MAGQARYRWVAASIVALSVLGLVAVQRASTVSPTPSAMLPPAPRALLPSSCPLLSSLSQSLSSAVYSHAHNRSTRSPLASPVAHGSSTGGIRSGGAAVILRRAAVSPSSHCADAAEGSFVVFVGVVVCVLWCVSRGVFEQATELVQYEQVQQGQQYEQVNQGVPSNWQQLTPISSAQAQQLAEPSTAFSVSSE